MAPRRAEELVPLGLQPDRWDLLVALAGNPKTPQPAAVKFLNYLQDKDLKNLMKSKEVPSVISTQSRRILQKKGKI